MDLAIPTNFEVEFSFDKPSATYLGLAIGGAIIIGIIIGGMVLRITK